MPVISSPTKETTTLRQGHVVKLSNANILSADSGGLGVFTRSGGQRRGSYADISMNRIWDEVGNSALPHIPSKKNEESQDSKKQ